MGYAHPWFFDLKKGKIILSLKDAIMLFLLIKESKTLLFLNPPGMSGKDVKRCFYVFLLKKESSLHYYCLTPLGW